MDREEKIKVTEETVLEYLYAPVMRLFTAQNAVVGGLEIMGMDHDSATQLVVKATASIVETLEEHIEKSGGKRLIDDLVAKTKDKADVWKGRNNA